MGGDGGEANWTRGVGGVNRPRPTVTPLTTKLAFENQYHNVSYIFVRRCNPFYFQQNFSLSSLQRKTPFVEKRQNVP